MPLQLVANRELSRWNEATRPVARAPPHEMISSDIERVAGFGDDSQHFFDAVAFRGHDLRDSTDVVNLVSDSIQVDQLANRHQTCWRADERVVRLARRNLLWRAGADVEPDWRVEAEHLMQQHPDELVLEDFGVGGRGEVAELLAGS